nr:ubiquitin-conjugating enzyme E2 [Candidatus Njordarchaeum guaymaensis]
MHKGSSDLEGGITEILSEDEYWARLSIEAKMLEQEEPTFRPIRGDIRIWRGYILGTGIYEGGVFQLEIEITRGFPFEPPVVRCSTPVFHPNFRGERVCLGILGKQWTPATSVAGVIEAIRNLLNFPNPDDPLNLEAAELMRKDLQKFKKEAAEWVKKHATWSKLKEPS